jgi:hypothetical protein
MGYLENQELYWDIKDELLDKLEEIDCLLKYEKLTLEEYLILTESRSYLYYTIYNA